MKKYIRIGMVIALLLAIYNLLVFVIPFDKSDIFWLSYGFTLDAFVIATVAFFIAFNKGKNAASRFYGFPIARVGAIYLGLQIALCFIFILLSQYIPTWLGVLVYAIALGAAVIGLVVTDTVRDYVEDQDTKLRAETSMVRTLYSKVNHMVLQCDTLACVSQMKVLAEELKFSDPVSSPEITNADTDLCGIIEKLQQAVDDGDEAHAEQLCKQATIALSERNRLCRLHKK